MTLHLHGRPALIAISLRRCTVSRRDNLTPTDNFLAEASTLLKTMLVAMTNRAITIV